MFTESLQLKDPGLTFYFFRAFLCLINDRARKSWFDLFSIQDLAFLNLSHFCSSVVVFYIHISNSIIIIINFSSLRTHDYPSYFQLLCKGKGKNQATVRIKKRKRKKHREYCRNYQSAIIEMKCSLDIFRFVSVCVCVFLS